MDTGVLAQNYPKIITKIIAKITQLVGVRGEIQTKAARLQNLLDFLALPRRMSGAEKNFIHPVW